jgi:hypothetical protein
MTILKNKLTLIVIAVIFSANFALAESANAAVPNEYKSCIPIVTNFTVSPARLLSRTADVKTTVRVDTIGCIVRGDVLGGSKWQVRLEFVNDNGAYYEDGSGSLVPGDSTYIRGSDFKRISNVTTSPDYNKYYATYNYDIGKPFSGQTGTTINIKPNLYWDFAGPEKTLQVENTGLMKKITAPALSTNTNTVNGNAGGSIDTNTGANFNVNLDSSIGNFWNPLKLGTLPEIITALIRILFALIGIMAVVIIIISGFRMVTANGNEEQLTKAKKAITWAIIGLVVSLLSFSIVAIIQRLIQVGAN